MSIAVELREVSRHFGEVRAVDCVSLAIEDGEFFSMLGPSGSGKTTCLRLIGGFELPTAGQIFLHGDDASDRPPYERDVNTVFQDYALFPHLSVLDNVAYGLRMKGIGRAARRREAAAALEQVALGGLGNRHPGQLSGGQRQRAALARALVNRPRVLLLDEPLGALDLKLREQMQVELKGLQRRLGITFVYVTHDQGEALSMSDRVAVFNGGRVEQVDHPRALYLRPRTPFVAGFVGTANVLTGELARRITGSDRPVSIRPERVAFGAPGPGELGIAGSVIDVQFHGPTSRFEIEAAGVRLAVTIANRDGDTEGGLPEPGDAVQLAWAPEAMVELRGSDPGDRAARDKPEPVPAPASPALPAANQTSTETATPSVTVPTASVTIPTASATIPTASATIPTASAITPAASAATPAATSLASSAGPVASNGATGSGATLVESLPLPTSSSAIADLDFPPTPSEETPTPSEETPMPSEETPTPSEETPTPSEETPTPLEDAAEAMPAQQSAPPTASPTSRGERGATESERGASASERGVTETEPRARPAEPHGASAEPGARPAESDGASTEPGTTTANPGATLTAPGESADPGAAPAETTDASAKPSEPRATPTEPDGTPGVPAKASGGSPDVPNPVSTLDEVS